MFLAHWKRAILAHPRPLLALFLGVLVPLWIFGALAEDVWTHAGFRWDAPILLAIHAHATPALDRLMIGVSTVGGPGGMAVLCVLVVAILLRGRRRRAALFVALAYGGAVLLDVLDKAAFRSARPHLWTSPAPASGYGFPSGHAMASMGLLAALALLAWPTRLRWPSLILAAGAITLIGFSRLYLGVHDPSDVVAAWMAALAWVIGLRLILLAHAAHRPPRSPSARRRPPRAAQRWPGP
jgi:membrane-associated phospholipid phosphatase